MRDSYPMVFEALTDPVGYMKREVMRQIKHCSGKPVRHQQTCPVCGKKMVNTYCRSGTWKCKKCWDEDGAADGASV